MLLNYVHRKRLEINHVTPICIKESIDREVPPIIRDRDLLDQQAWTDRPEFVFFKAYFEQQHSINNGKENQNGKVWKKGAGSSERSNAKI